MLPEPLLAACRMAVLFALFFAAFAAAGPALLALLTVLAVFLAVFAALGPALSARLTALPAARTAPPPALFLVLFAAAGPAPLFATLFAPRLILMTAASVLRLSFFLLVALLLAAFLLGVPLLTLLSLVFEKLAFPAFQPGRSRAAWE